MSEESNNEKNEVQNDDSSQSKHKIKGKHKLPYDSIFKGKKNDPETDDDPGIPKQESFDFDVSSSYYDENKDPDDYNRLKELREEIYDIVVENLKLNIKASRRKPGRVDFNNYMEVLVENLDMKKFSHSEVFMEFAFYFSDNIVNMFKLLDKKWGGKIAKELADRGKIRFDDIDFV
jgi:hypothetical protein